MPADLGAIESLDFTDQEQVQSMLADAEANLARTVSIAPEELRADFQTVLESSMSMVAQLAENGGDFTKLDVTNFDNPEFMAAAERVEAYNADVCGYDAATATLPTEVSADTMSATLEALLAPLKAQMNLSDDQVTCLSEKMAASMTEAGSAPDISAVMTYFTDCGINPAGG